MHVQLMLGPWVDETGVQTRGCFHVHSQTVVGVETISESRLGVVPARSA